MTIYTIDEAAELLKVSRSTIYRLLRDGLLESCTIRSRRRITDEQVTRYLHATRDRFTYTY